MVREEYLLPRVLLLGPSQETIEALVDLPYQVTIGRHGNNVRFAPSPTDWDLIIHVRCGDSAAKPVDDLSSEINDEYLSEVNCPEVHISWGGRCHGLDRRPVSGYRDFEALPGESPRYQDVIDFFEEREFDLYLKSWLYRTVAGRNGELTVSEPGEVLAVNQYGNPIAAIWTLWGRQLLALSPPVGDAGQPRVVGHLLRRTLPKLFPRAFMGEFTPEKIRVLEAEKDALIATTHARVREINAAIDAERDYYAPFSVLPRTRDGALRTLAGRTLSEFGFQVTDLDLDKDEGRKETYDADLMLDAADAKGYAETKASGNRNCSIGDLEAFMRNVAKARTLYGAEEYRLLIYNGQIDVPEARRGPAFSGDVIAEAIEQGIALVTGQGVLDALQAVRSEILEPEKVRSRLRIPGLVDFPISRGS